MQNKELCNCGKVAVWLYMPGYSSGCNDFSCDDCVPRGCECNHDYKGIGGESLDDFINQTKDDVGKYYDKDGVEVGTPQEAAYFIPLDNKNREYPCCEYDHDEDGYDKE